MRSLPANPPPDETLPADPAPDAGASPAPPKSLLARLGIRRGNLRTLLIIAACVIGRPTPTSLVVGWALLLVGEALHLWARGCLRINREVTTSGPYAWSRNPFYVGNALIDAGLLAVAANPWLAAVAVPVWALVHHDQISREERTLASLFGAPYADYVARVPRFFPWRGRVRDLPPSPGFTWRNPSIAEGKEFARLVRIAASPLLVFVVAAVRSHGFGVLGDARSHVLGAIAVLAAATTLEWALFYRVRHGRRVAPAWMRSPVAEGFALLVVAVAIAAHLPPPGLRPLFEMPAGLAVSSLVLAALVVTPVRTASEPVVACAAEALACLGAAFVAGCPAIGAAGCAVLGVAAIDRIGTPDADRTRSWVRRAVAAAVALGSVAALAPLASQ